MQIWLFKFQFLGDEFNHNQSLRAELGIQSTYQLTERSYIRNLKVVSLSLKEYAPGIIQECTDFNLIGDDIWTWDRRFFECNCSGIKDKKTGQFSDTDAGPDSGDCFRGEYIPGEYHRVLGKLYDLRTIIERKNSNEVVGYNRSEMPTCGIS